MYGSEANRPPAGNGRSTVSSRTPCGRPATRWERVAVKTNQTAAARTATRLRAISILARRGESETDEDRRAGRVIISRSCQRDIRDSQQAVSTSRIRSTGRRRRRPVGKGPVRGGRLGDLDHLVGGEVVKR